MANVVDFSLQQLTLLFLFASIFLFFLSRDRGQRAIINVAIVFFGLILAFLPPAVIITSQTTAWYYPSILTNQIGMMLWPLFAIALIVQFYMILPEWMGQMTP